MKKILNIIAIALMMPIVYTSTANAEEITYHYGDGTSGTTPPTPAQSEVGGFAVVNPETGVVHGVIAGSIEYFNQNNRTMGSEFMGCVAGCQIIMQSTSDQNGNVVGIYGPNVTYDGGRNVFQITQSDTIQSEIVTESASNTSAIETEVSSLRSVRNYEFGVQDFRSSTGQFQMTEVAPAQNTNVKIAAKTKEYACQDREMACSRYLSSSSITLIDESVLFSERSTGSQVLEKVIVEAKNKVREQISLILSMLEGWIIN